MYYDRQGRPMDMADWARRFSDYAYKVVAWTTVSGWHVSTVWTGLDMNYSGQGPPVIFETMVFPPEEVHTDEEYCVRYATEAEARAGHEEAVRWTGQTVANLPPVRWRIVPADFSEIERQLPTRDDFNAGGGS